MKNTTFHNTTHLTGIELQTEIDKAKTQQDKVLTAFKESGKEMTPFEVQELLGDDAIITSVRRAISNLTRDGFLKQTGDYRLGKYGKKNFVWAAA